MNDPRGLAPAGWHIPSDAEWTTLEKSLGGASVAGGKMKEAGMMHWATPNAGGNNSSGWAGLPGGCRGVNGFFSNVGEVGWWWSSSEGNTPWSGAASCPLLWVVMAEAAAIHTSVILFVASEIDNPNRPIGTAETLLVQICG